MVGTTTKRVVFVIIMLTVILLVYGAYVKLTMPDYGAFASCLTQNNIVMYGTNWCPHCQNQKKMFGSAFKDIIFIDCDVSPDCKELGIKAYPTWAVNGTLLEPGVMELDALGGISDCELPA